MSTGEFIHTIELAVIIGLVVSGWMRGPRGPRGPQGFQGPKGEPGE